MTARRKAYAKLNLTLGVGEKREGYHELDSLVCNVDISDSVRVSSRKDDLITVSMQGLGSEAIELERNNAYRAAAAYRDRFSTPGADIKIYKNIPMGFGFGGSSADAAAVLNCLRDIYQAGTKQELFSLAMETGSDAGVLMENGSARMRGRGEKVKRLDAPKRLNFLLLIPPRGVSTAECFSRYDGAMSRSSDEAEKAMEAGDERALGAAMFNDLYETAVSINPDVKTAYEDLKDFSPLGVTMTGTGSAVFALFENDAFCEWAKSRYRGKFNCVRCKSL